MDWKYCEAIICCWTALLGLYIIQSRSDSSKKLKERSNGPMRNPT